MQQCVFFIWDFPMIYLLMTEHALWVFRLTRVILIRWNYRSGARIFCQCGLSLPKNFTTSTEKNNCPKKPRSNRPARKLLVPGYTGDFLKNPSGYGSRNHQPRNVKAKNFLGYAQLSSGWAELSPTLAQPRWVNNVLNFVLWINQLLT